VFDVHVPQAAGVRALGPFAHPAVSSNKHVTLRRTRAIQHLAASPPADVPPRPESLGSLLDQGKRYHFPWLGAGCKPMLLLVQVAQMGGTCPSVKCFGPHASNALPFLSDSLHCSTAL
jgi:hypothetical protein